MPPLFTEGTASRSHLEYVEGDSLHEMITENLVAERVAIQSYRELINYFGEKDVSSRRLMESVLAVEEEHAEHRSTLLETMGAG